MQTNLAGSSTRIQEIADFGFFFSKTQAGKQYADTICTKKHHLPSGGVFITTS